MALQRFSHSGGVPQTGLTGSITSAQLSFTVLSATGYPSGAGGPFVIAIDQGASSEEHVLISAVSGSTFTVASGGRGYDNTSAAAHNAGPSNVQFIYSAAEANDNNDHVYTVSRNDHTQYVLYSGLAGAGTAVSGSGTSTFLTVSGAVLARTFYNPSTQAIYNASTSATAVDGTNLTATFNAPASGSVWVRMGAGNAVLAGVNQYLYLGGLIGSNQYGFANIQVNYNSSQPTDAAYAMVEFPVTGLTPGTGYTIQMAFFKTGSSTAQLYVGGWGSGNPAGGGVIVVEAY